MDENNEIDLVELYFKVIKEVKLLFFLFLNHIIIFFLIALLGGFFGYSYVNKFKPIYNAELSFLVVNENSNGSMMSSLSNLSGLLGMRGTLINGSLDGILQLIESDKIIFKVLFKTVDIDNKKDFIINHFIKYEKLDNKWVKNNDTLLSNILYKDKVKEISDLSFAQRKAFKQIKNILFFPKNNSIISKMVDNKTSTIKLLIKHTNENLAIEIANNIYEELLDFYMTKSNYSKQNNVDILVRKVDSLQVELNTVQNSVARTSDKTLGLLLQENKLESKQLAIKEQILIIILGEAQKNLENYRIMNEIKNPPLTLMDYPYSPIDPIVKSKNKFILIGILISIFLLLFYYRLRLLLKNN